MQEILSPIDKEILKKEINESTFLRYTNYGDIEVHVVNHHKQPNAILEIGRLRELTFRTAGGGTGQEVDIDENDTCEDAYYMRYCLTEDATIPFIPHNRISEYDAA